MGGMGQLPQNMMPMPFPPFPGGVMQAPTGQGQTLDQMGGKLNNAFQGMNNAMQNIDPENPQSMMDAQKAMNQYEQTMQLMTTMMKMLHDMNMAIIRNMH